MEEFDASHQLSANGGNGNTGKSDNNHVSVHGGKGHEQTGDEQKTEPLERKLLNTLEQLLAVEATNLKSALDHTSDLISQALAADKCDAFLYDPSIGTLVAVGTSHTPMGKQEEAMGLDRIPLANRGRTVEVFETGKPYITGRADEDPYELAGLKFGLGIRSIICVSLEVGGERRGVIQVDAAQADKFSQQDLEFLEAVSRWVGVIAHRAELVERIAQDAAEQARRVTAEELVTVLAHDLGNYFTPLQGRIEMIRRQAKREGNEKILDNADAAQSALIRLGELVKDLLDVGRLEQGLLALSLQPVDLVTLVTETVGLMQTAQVKVLLRVPGEAPGQVRDQITAGQENELESEETVVVKADPARIRQVLENLLSNALKHAPEGVPVTVEVGSETRDAGEWATVLVRDEGPGIPTELLPRLFTRFASGPDSTGLGLGLYLAHSIAEAHGGTLTVESNSGEGTAFCLSLPVSPPGR